MYKVGFKPTPKEEKGRRIRELTSWAISYRIRDEKQIVDEDIARNHIYHGGE